MREGIVLSLLRGGIVCRASIPARTVPTGPRVGGFALVVFVKRTLVVLLIVVILGADVNSALTATVVVDLIGALPRVRAGAVRLKVVICFIVPVTRVVVVHLPSAQEGVVLPGAVRAGTEVVADNGARDPMLLSTRDAGGVTRPRVPVPMPVFRGGRVDVDMLRAPLLP